MRNRAKCGLCRDVLESFHATDLVICSCGEISIDGGDALRCSAKHWENFLRIDDKGNMVPVRVEDKTPAIPAIPATIETKPTKDELLGMLDEMIKSFERLPQNAMSSHTTHYDLLSVLLLVSSLFKAET